MYFNSSLQNITLCLEAISKKITGGFLAIPVDYRDDALTISRGDTPLSWLKRHESPVKFVDWVTGK